MEKLKTTLRDFADARKWHPFHTPKNLAMALSVEVAELAEHFQWLTEEQSRNLDVTKLEQVGEEVADCLIYLIRLSERLGIDPIAAAERKIAINERRYPIDRVRGDARRASEYEE